MHDSDPEQQQKDLKKVEMNWEDESKDLDGEELKASTPEEAAFNGIREYVDSETIYKCIFYKTLEEFEKRGKFDFKGVPSNILKTLPFHKYENGHFYAGQVNPDTNKREGQGIYVNAQANSIYEGYWLDDEYHGRGREIYSMRAVYEGEWQNGKKHGKGIFECLDGLKYEGDYVEGKCHGIGVMVEADGTRYEGQFKDSLMHGQGVMIYPNGDKKEGIWRNDEFIGDQDHDQDE